MIGNQPSIPDLILFGACVRSSKLRINARLMSASSPLSLFRGEKRSEFFPSFWEKSHHIKAHLPSPLRPLFIKEQEQSGTRGLMDSLFSRNKHAGSICSDNF